MADELLKKAQDLFEGQIVSYYSLETVINRSYERLNRCVHRISKARGWLS